jgi:hypothetical protein
MKRLVKLTAAALTCFAKGSLANSNDARNRGRRSECEPVLWSNDRAKSEPAQ